MKDRRRPVSTELDAASALETIASEVRSGGSLAAALPAVLADHPTLLGTLRADLRRGAPMTVALEDAIASHPAESVVLQALRTSSMAGGPMADTLERGAAILRERQAWADERHSHAAQARLSATLLTLIPVGFAALGFASSTRVRAAYAEVPLTVPISIAGVLLNAVGWWWMRRLIRGAT